MENKYKNSKKNTSKGTFDKSGRSFGFRKEQPRSRVLSLAQLLSRVRKQRGNLLQSNSNSNPNLQSINGSKESNTQNRNLQLNKQGLNAQRDKNTFSPLRGPVNSNNITKGSNRVEREEQKRQKPIKPIIPPKTLVIILKEKPEQILYNRRLIDYKHCGLLQRYIGLGGKILPRRQTRLTAKQQRYIAKTIKSARIMGLLPFVSKEKGFFR